MIYNNMYFKMMIAKFHIGSCYKITLKGKKKSNNIRGNLTGSAMDEKTIVNMKAGRAGSLSRSDGNKGSLIS